MGLRMPKIRDVLHPAIRACVALDRPETQVVEQIAQRLEAIRRGLEGERWGEVRLMLQDAAMAVREAIKEWKETEE